MSWDLGDLSGMGLKTEGPSWGWDGMGKNREKNLKPQKKQPNCALYGSMVLDFEPFLLLLREIPSTGRL